VQKYLAFEVPTNDPKNWSAEWIVVPVRRGDGLLRQLKAKAETDTDVHYYEPNNLVNLIGYIGKASHIAGKRPTFTFVP
jgi:hypothetical protein